MRRCEAGHHNDNMPGILVANLNNMDGKIDGSVETLGS